jgi:hypothetical protein
MQDAVHMVPSVNVISRLVGLYYCDLVRILGEDGPSSST